MPGKVYTKKSLCEEYGWSLNTLNKEIETALPEVYDARSRGYSWWNCNRGIVSGRC